jgi:hypothetical protein
MRSQARQKRIEVAPREIVAHLDDDRRAAPPEQQRHRHRDDRVGGTGDEQNVRPQPANRGGQREDHPQRFPAALVPARLARHLVADIGELFAHRPVVAAENQRCVHPHRAPMPDEAQCHALHAARREAVQEGKNADSSAAIMWRQSRIPLSSLRSSRRLASFCSTRTLRSTPHAPKSSRQRAICEATTIHIRETTPIRETRTTTRKFFPGRAGNLHGRQ